jgi:hypothetical protein
MQHTDDLDAARSVSPDRKAHAPGSRPASRGFRRGCGIAGTSMPRALGRLLRARRKRPRDRRAAEKRDEFASSHWITSLQASRSRIEVGAVGASDRKDSTPRWGRRRLHCGISIPAMTAVGSRRRLRRPPAPVLPQYLQKLTQIQHFGLRRKVPTCMARPRGTRWTFKIDVASRAPVSRGGWTDDWPAQRGPLPASPTRASRGNAVPACAGTRSWLGRCQCTPAGWEPPNPLVPPPIQPKLTWNSAPAKTRRGFFLWTAVRANVALAPPTAVWNPGRYATQGESS